MAAFTVRKIELTEAQEIPDLTAIEDAADKLDLKLVTALWKSTVVAGLLAPGEVWVAETNDRKIIGCAVWFGPNHTLYDTEKQQKEALGPFMAAMSAKVQQWWVQEFLPKYGVFVESTLGPGVKHASWHLQTLGIHPEYRRQGAATLLVRTIAEKAAGVPMCAEVDTDLHLEIFGRKSMGFRMMPEDKEGKDECGAEYTGVTGDTVTMWVMATPSK
ncbi:hypothetical protein C8R47DRAFT_1243106 [Mycena vitilis]|nr:hypothetical protein C8R47DRAFT_1243106 [Mycena vitilis]